MACLSKLTVSAAEDHEDMIGKVEPATAPHPPFTDVKATFSRKREKGKHRGWARIVIHAIEPAFRRIRHERRLAHSIDQD